MRLPSAFETIVIAIVLAMETCAWVAVAEVFGLPHPLTLLFGVPFVIAVATRIHWSAGLAAFAALVAYAHPPFHHLADTPNLVALAFVIRGAEIGSRFISVAEIRIWIMAGLGVFILLATVGWPRTAGPPLEGMLAGLTGGYVALGVLATILLQRAEIEVATLGRRSGAKIGLLVAVLTPFLVLLAGAVVIAGGGPAMFDAMLEGIHRVSPAIAWLMAWPLGLIDAFLAWMAWLLKNVRRDPPEDGPGLTMPASNPSMFPHAKVIAVKPIDLTGALHVAELLVLLALLVWVAMRIRPRRKRSAAFAEERSSIWSWGRVRDDLSRLFRREASEPPVAWDPLPPVREAYRAMLRALATRGVARPGSSTPAEFIEVAVAAKASVRGDLARLTAMYEGARYGGAPGDEAAAHALGVAIAAEFKPLASPEGGVPRGE